MDSLFGHLNPGAPPSRTSHELPPHSLKLLPELEPWGRSFRRNVADLLLRRNPTPPTLTARPGVYWPDVFVHQRLPWQRFAESAAYHVLLVAGLYALSFWPTRPAVTPIRAFDNSQVLYFSASDYLPPLDTGDQKPHSSRPADPEFAKQPILSVPPEASNPSQTIVSPPNVQLSQDVATPNIVAWGDHSVPVPVDATQSSPLSLASLTTPIVAPPPAAVERDSAAPSLNAAVVAPPPDANLARSARALDPAQHAIIAPPPSVDLASRPIADMNVVPSSIIVPAPQLPVAAQRVASSFNAGNAAIVPPPPTLDAAPGKAAGGAQSTRSALGAAVVPPPPSMGGAAASAGDRLIALGLHPAAVAPPPAPGNRKGTFMATPDGKPGATGTPGSTASSTRGNVTGDDSGIGTSHPRASPNGIPPGLQVGAPPSPPTSATGGSSHASADVGNAVNPQLLAKASPPPSIPRSATPPSQATELERKVFGDHPFYSMTLNMPNLNSAGGSWIMRFAELRDSDSAAELSAPRALHKVDPAYPLELMRQNVAGTVAVRAIIRADGSVSDVSVLRSVDERLDRYACEALARWQFSPATRSGTPVDLAVVVMIPFRPVVHPRF